jgi:hypothetical protein
MDAIALKSSMSSLGCSANSKERVVLQSVIFRELADSRVEVNKEPRTLAVAESPVVFHDAGLSLVFRQQ